MTQAAHQVLPPPHRHLPSGRAGAGVCHAVRRQAPPAPAAVEHVLQGGGDHRLHADAAPGELARIKDHGVLLQDLRHQLPAQYAGAAHQG